MPKSKRKKPDTGDESDLKTIKQHLADMVSYSSDLLLSIDYLNEEMPNLDEVGNELDISLSENESGDRWKDFSRAEAHEWLGKAYSKVEMLKKFNRRAGSIAFELNEVFENAQAAVELTEAVLKKVDATFSEEVA